MKYFFLVSIAFFLFIQPLFAQNTLDNAGLTSATPSQVAFSLRKLSSTYNGFAIKVRRALDNAEANVAFNGSGGLTAGSLVSFTPGVTLSSTLGTAQTGTISTDVSKTGTITINATKTGTITTGSGILTVTGTGTNFTAEIVAGDRLFNAANNVFLGVVASITDNTTLLLTNYATQSLSSVSFKSTGAVVTGTGTNFTGELATGDRLFNSTNTYLGTVASITNATTLTLNAVDAVSSTGISFKSTLAAITGTGTNFTSLAVGDLLISNNITLGIISSITNATSLTLTTKAGGSVSGLAYRSTTGTIAFSTFYASTSVFVNTWYDQSGYGRDAIQLKTANQARIVNAGTLYIVNARTSVEFASSLNSFLQTSTAATYLNNTLYTLNKVTAEATIIPILQLPISTTGGNGPGNSISHYGYRNSSLFTVAQYGNDQNFNATPSTTLELHTSVKISIGSSQFYKNGISLGILTSGVPSHLSGVGLLNIGYYSPTFSYYSGSVSEMIVFSTALGSADITLLNGNQLAYYNIASNNWTGAVSTDWTDAANWSAGTVPTISSPAIVVIPTGKPFYPIISGTSPANSISMEAGTSLTITGTLQLAGTLINLGTCTASAGTVQYVGSAPQSITANTFAGNTVQNIIINNSTSVALASNITVSGNLTFTTGKLAIGAYTLTLGGTVINTVTGGLTGSSNSILVINGGTASPTLSFDQTTINTTNAIRNLTINSSGQVATLANNLILLGSGNTTFTAGKLAIGSSTLTIRGAVVNTVSEGIRGSTIGNLIVDGTLSPTLSFDQSIPATTNALNNFTINASGQTVTSGGNLEVNGAMAFTAGILAINGNTLTLNGTVSNGTGTLKGSSSSNLVIGTATATIPFMAGGTDNYLKNLTVKTSSSMTIGSNGLNITAGTTPGTVIVNGTLNTAGLLTLKSDANGTARVGTSAGTFSGNTTIERYIPQRRAWRFLAAPVTSAGSPTINASWQEGQVQTTPSPALNNVPGYGTHITGGTTGNGFDQSPSNNPSIKEYINNAWVGVANTNVTKVTGQQGYMLFVRGSRSVDLSAGQYSSLSNTTLRIVGALKTGLQTLTVAASGFEIAGNPYASAIDMHNIAIANSTVINDNFKLWDPKMGGQYNVGGFVTVTWNTGTGSYDYVPAPVSALSQHIQSGSAFFVESAGGGTLNIIEANKSASGSDNVNFVTGVDERMRIDLRSVTADASNPVVDGVLTTYYTGNSNTVNSSDAAKLDNLGTENIAILREGIKLSVERREIININDTTYLNIANMNVKEYNLDITAQYLNHPGLRGFLVDNFTSAETILNLDGNTLYSFTITNDTASAAANRFKIIFRLSGILPVTISSIKAVSQGKNIMVEWKVENQVNIDHYEIERAIDGINFSKTGSQSVIGANGSGTTYHWLDINPASADNFYRIKVININGSSDYSPIVKVNMAKGQSLITVSPNPTEGKIIMVKLNQVAKGNYTVNMFSTDGRKVFGTTVTHNGGIGNFTLTLDKKLSDGIYFLYFSGASINQQVKVVVRE